VLPPGGVPWLPDATDELAARLHIDQVELQELIDLLQARQQVVFYGPPGTGKTYLAKELARHIVGADRSRARLVQFHPSYAYEDFFEGFRPTETAAGQASFRLTSGPLRRIAAAAAASPEYPHVLVIDELNRANLAKVFGELYFLLEYRNESINLQYRPTEAFRLPPNLFFIGTMNTADRSIALLDAAMRRRFSFVELHPDEAPVSGVLARWLAASGFDDDRAQLLAALNAAIDDQDRDLRIGPSYLMRQEANTDKGLARVWRYDIMPLLEEHYYGRGTRTELNARFGLDALRESLVTTSGAPTTDGGDAQSGSTFDADQTGPTGGHTSIYGS
jgi:5-methylcytosine-specific restriction protein B